MADTKPDGRSSPPRAVDLRRGRAPDVDIIACDTFDFLISLRVALAAPDTDFTGYDVGRQWMESARSRCAAHDTRALATVGHYLGDGRPTSLHATLISLVSRCPEPRDTPHFLDWLDAMPANELAEVLLDQDGLGADWSEVLSATLASPRNEETQARLLTRYVEELWPTVARIVDEPEAARAELVGALRVWYDAVYAREIERVLPMVRREAAALERRRAELPVELFIEEAMRGVLWQRPAGLRRIIFAPSYFARPAVFYHFWRGTLTFCPQVDDTRLEPVERSEMEGPSGIEVLRVFEALGDPTRLRILRLLSQREMYLTELAEQLGLTKATTKHHMVRLRAAGLVTLYDRERLTYYAIRPDVAAHADQVLRRYLGSRD